MRQPLLFACATAVYAATAWSTLAITQASGGIATIWIANAMVVGYLVHRPATSVPMMLAAVVTAVTLVGSVLQHGVFAAFLGGLTNALEIGLVWLALKHLRLRPGTPLSDRDVFVFLGVSVLLAPAIAAVFGASLPRPGSGVPWIRSWVEWWRADAFGMFLVLPLAWAAERTSARQVFFGPRAASFWALILTTAVVVAASLVYVRHPFVLISLPLLIVAVRTGVFGTAFCNLVMIVAVLLVVFAQQQGHLPLSESTRGPAELRGLWLVACLSAVGPLLVAFMSDQRERERLRALQANERMRVLTDTLPAFVAEVGPDLRYRFVNAKYESAFGRPAEEIVGLRPADLMDAETAARIESRLRQSLEGRSQRFELELKDGTVMEAAYEPLPSVHGVLVLASDVTWRYEAERRFRNLLECAPDPMVVVDRSSRRMLLANVQAEHTFGYPRDDLLGMTIDDLLIGGETLTRALLDDQLRSNPSGQGGSILELKGRRHDGTTFPAEVMLGSLQGEQSQVVATIRDVSARRRTERDLHLERERAQVTLASIGDAVITYDTGGRITSLNPVAESMTGWSHEEAVGRPYSQVVRLHDLATGAALPDGAPDTGTEISAILQRRDDTELHVEDSDSPLRDSEGTVIGGVTVLRDISEAHAMRQRMAHLARHDYLTGLPNRVLLQDRLSQALDRLQPGQHGALLFIDLDLFKHINDSLGHPIGDRVLEEIAERLVDAARPGDTVSRQGGDEFVLLAPGVEREEAGRIASRLIRLIEDPIQVDDRQLHLSASVGIALFPDDSDDMRTLLKQADTALYHAKRGGRGRCHFFTQVMSERAEQRMQLETELRAGIDAGQLFLLFQPKVRLPLGLVSGFEVLVRWRKADGRLVPPTEFIPLAEESGLVNAIDDWVVGEACRQHRRWLDAGLPRVPMAVNLSLARLRPERVIAHLQRVIADTGLPPHLLEVEFTESQMLDQHALAQQLVDGIRGLGARLAVDDFGTGYSSLSYLTRYRFDTIKVDQTFVSGLPGDIENSAVVQAILSMARTLDCAVVAEGVETDAQARALLGMGCDEMQGYRFSPPVDAQAMEALLRAGRVEPAGMMAG